ncbi:MAG: SDR family oxidoreductase [Candidatus Sericytochromatia bacterium]|nr:SDR family oxidoreductase [Candidatus Sericytochromatia bacterium]
MRKAIVITGASSGIGATLARLLGSQGHRLVLAARSEAALQQVAAESGEAQAVVTDVTQRADVERLRDTAIAAYGHVDVWINNAGKGIARSVLDLSDADFDEMMTVNTKSALYGIQAIVPHFQARGTGHLINISSFLGKVPVASFRSAYSASKAALNSLTANLRMDLSATYPDIHVTLVLPGVVLTDFAKNAVGGGQPLPTLTGPMTPQTPEEVAAAIARVIEHPVAELYTNPAQHDLANRYVQDVAAFEGAMRP